MDDKKIITSLRAGKRERPIKALYKEYSKIEKLMLSNGLSKEVSKELFNDSLIILIEKVQSPEFALTSKLTTYLYGINRLLAKNELKRQRKKNEIEWNGSIVIDPTDLSYDLEKEEKIKQLEHVLTQISEKCLLIFKLFYYEKKSMSQIAEDLGYTSTNSAKTQKYKCIERAFELSNNTPN